MSGDPTNRHLVPESPNLDKYAASTPLARRSQGLVTVEVPICAQVNRYGFPQTLGST